MQNRVYLDIQKNLEEYVEKIKDFNTSIFREVYISLYDVLNEILIQEDRKKGNIITVMGERGSGKTSLMLSFTQSLKERSNPYIKHSEARFCVMENVDASMLDSSEDIFDILLSRMLKKFDEYSDDNRLDDHKNRKVQYQILQLIDEIYIMHQQIKKKKGRESDAEKISGYSSLSTLRNSSDSLELTRKFEQLVNNYLEVMLGNWGEDGEQKNYLIVSIDDLDMNSENGFESLEQIYRYVAVKNVIVVVAVKYGQILYLAEKNGYKIYPKIDKELDNNKVDYVKEYAKEYLAKLLPIQGRVHMPDIRMVQQEFQNKWYVKEQGKDYTIKESILFKISEKTGMYFDICENRMLILEPKSLRELKGYYGYLDRQLGNDLLDNIELFSNDFLDRMVVRELTYEFMSYIQEFYRLDYAGINERLMSILREKRGQMLFSYTYKESYGELLRYLYQLSENKQEEKTFVDATLVFYTYLVQKERLKGGEIGANVISQTVMQDLLLNSWAGSWSNYFVPKIHIEDKSETEGEKDALLKLADEEYWERNWGYMDKIFCSVARIGMAFEKCDAASSEDWIKKYSKLINALEWIFFFFEGFYSEVNEKEDICLKFGSKEWHLENYRCEFNILAFIKHSYYYKEYFEKLYTAIATALIEMLKEDRKNISQVKTQLKKTSKFYKEYVKWFQMSEGVAVPFQYPDIYYHILVRLQTMSRNQVDSSVRSNDVIDSLKGVFERLEKLLQEEEDGYRAADDIKFVKKFKECPFVKMLREERGEVISKKEFGEIISRCAKISISNRRHGRAKGGLTTSDDISFQDYGW